MAETLEERRTRNRVRQRQYYQEHRAEVCAKQRAYGRAIRLGDRREDTLAKQRLSTKRYRDAHPERVKERERLYRSLTGLRRMAHRHSLTVADYERLLALQGGRCAICQQPETVRPGERLSIDHDHTCCPGAASCGRCVRGLLCSQCNAGGGFLRDDPALLRAAADYFEKGTI